MNGFDIWHWDLECCCFLLNKTIYMYFFFNFLCVYIFELQNLSYLLAHIIFKVPGIFFSDYEDGDYFLWSAMVQFPILKNKQITLVCFARSTKSR